MTQEQAAIHDFYVRQQYPPERMATVHNLPVTLDRMGETQGLDVDQLDKEMAATEVRTRFTHPDFSLVDLRRNGGEVGNVLVKHRTRNSNGEITEVDLVFQNIRAELENILPANIRLASNDTSLDVFEPGITTIPGEIKDVDPSDDHLAIGRMMEPLVNTFHHLREINIPYSIKSPDDPGGLKLPRAAHELYKNERLHEDLYTTMKLDQETGINHVVIKSDLPAVEIGSIVLAGLDEDYIDEPVTRPEQKPTTTAQLYASQEDSESVTPSELREFAEQNGIVVPEIPIRQA